MAADIPLSEAMLCWSRGASVRVVEHPDERGLSDDYDSSAGACYSYWRGQSPDRMRLQLLIDAWHVAVFYDVPVADIHSALLVIPE
jgi:hypothetical protein